MAVLVFSTSPSKGGSATVQLDKAELANLVEISGDAYWSDTANVAKVGVLIISTEGNQKKYLDFDFQQTTPEAELTFSSTARDVFQIRAIVLKDHDNGILIIGRETSDPVTAAELAAYDSDLDLNEINYSYIAYAQKEFVEYDYAYVIQRYEDGVLTNGQVSSSNFVVNSGPVEWIREGSEIVDPNYLLVSGYTETIDYEPKLRILGLNRTILYDNMLGQPLSLRGRSSFVYLGNFWVVAYWPNGNEYRIYKNGVLHYSQLAGDESWISMFVKYDHVYVCGSRFYPGSNTYKASVWKIDMTASPTKTLVQEATDTKPYHEYNDLWVENGGPNDVRACGYASTDNFNLNPIISNLGAGTFVSYPQAGQFYTMAYSGPGALRAIGGTSDGGTALFFTESTGTVSSVSGDSLDIVITGVIRGVHNNSSSNALVNIFNTSTSKNGYCVVKRFTDTNFVFGNIEYEDLYNESPGTPSYSFEPKDIAYANQYAGIETRYYAIEYSGYLDAKPVTKLGSTATVLQNAFKIPANSYIYKSKTGNDGSEVIAASKFNQNYYEFPAYIKDGVFYEIPISDFAISESEFYTAWVTSATTHNGSVYAVGNITYKSPNAGYYITTGFLWKEGTGGTTFIGEPPSFYNETYDFYDIAVDPSSGIPWIYGKINESSSSQIYVWSPSTFGGGELAGYLYEFQSINGSTGLNPSDLFILNSGTTMTLCGSTSSARPYAYNGSTEALIIDPQNFIGFDMSYFFQDETGLYLLSRQVSTNTFYVYKDGIQQTYSITDPDASTADFFVKNGDVFVTLFRYPSSGERSILVYKNGQLISTVSDENFTWGKTIVKELV